MEVYVNGQWGTICEDLWSLADGVVACQQLGYGTVYDTLRQLPFGANENLPILLDNLVCGSFEDRLQNCFANVGNTSHNCDHSKDAGLVCIDASKFKFFNRRTVATINYYYLFYLLYSTHRLQLIQYIAK